MSAAKITDVGDPEPTPAVSKVRIRGVLFVFNELEVSAYDKLVKQATTEEPDDNGIMQEVTDNTLLLRLMVLKSCSSPKLTADSLNAYGTRMYRAMARVVNELHYGEEPIVVVTDDGESAAEETPTGNA